MITCNIVLTKTAEKKVEDLFSEWGISRYSSPEAGLLANVDADFVSRYLSTDCTYKNVCAIEMKPARNSYEDEMAFEYLQ